MNKLFIIPLICLFTRIPVKNNNLEHIDLPDNPTKEIKKEKEQRPKDKGKRYEKWGRKGREKKACAL